MNVVDVFDGFDVENPVVIIIDDDREKINNVIEAVEKNIDCLITDDVIYASKTVEKRIDNDYTGGEPLVLVKTIGEDDLDSLEYVHIDHIIDQGNDANVGAIIGMVTNGDENVVEVAQRTGGMKARVLSRALLFDVEYVEAMFN